MERRDPPIPPPDYARDVRLAEELKAAALVVAEILDRMTAIGLKAEVSVVQVDCDITHMLGTGARITRMGCIPTVTVHRPI